MTLLMSLRIFAPITLSDLADKLGSRAGLNEDQTEVLLRGIVKEAERLRAAGLAGPAHPYRGYEWSCTEAGCRVVDGHEGIEAEASGSRRDEARECVGVRS